MDHIRLTPLGKLVLFIAVLTIGAFVGAAGASATKPHARDWRCVSVRPGDTLWGLARAASDDDPRAVIERVIRHNRLAGAAISPGATLWVPREDGGLGGLAEAEPERCAALG